MKKIMSIALFSDPRTQGGIETFNRNIKKFYPENLKILINYNENKKKIYEVEGILEQTKESAMFKLMNKIFFNKLREKKIKNIIKKENPDILIFSLFYELNILKFFKGKKILVQHFNFEKLAKEINISILKKYLDYYVVLSSYDKEKFKIGFGLDDRKIKVIRHTCNIELLQSKKEKNKKLIMIARIDNFQKRFDLAIKAMKKLPDFILNIYGEFHTEKDKKYLEEIVKKEKITNVNFKGITNKVQEKLDESGIFVMTSDSEGYGITNIEAMRRGLPIILRNTFEAAQDIVIDNGVLLEKEWNEDKFVEAVRKVYDNYEYYSENSKKLGERHSPEVIKKEWDKLFAEINYKA
jgi:glycosyltransferase involved in cell wall biosynthesis